MQNDEYEKIISHASNKLAGVILEDENAAMFDQCNQADDIDRPELDAALQSMLNKHKTIHTFRKLVATIAVVISVTMTLAVSVNAFGIRDKLYRLIVRDNKDHFSLRVEEQEPTMLTNTELFPSGESTLDSLQAEGFPFAPSQLPPGYALDQHADWGAFGDVYFAIYRHTELEDMLLYFTVSTTGLDKEMDSELGEISSVVIHGYQGKLVEHPNRTVLIWHIDDCFLELDGQISREEIVEIAKSVIPL